MANSDKKNKKLTDAEKVKLLKKKLKKLRNPGEAKSAPQVAESTAAPVTPTAKAKIISPLAPVTFPVMPLIEGVEFAAGAAGVKYKGRTDVMLVKLAPGTSIAGAFTKSSTRAASILDCQAKLALKQDTTGGAAIVVNSGNANAFTGAAGQASVDAVTGAVAQKLGVPQNRVFSSSTGVIGEPLPHDRITAIVDQLSGALSTEGIEDAAEAIMTTDTFPKGSSIEIPGEGGVIQIAGIAKGSGMIAPDMATMLVYIFTDAKIAPDALQKIVSRMLDQTFNAITVDSDTSTSDALIVAATGKSKAEAITDMRGKVARDFTRGLKVVMQDLAQQVVRDGEGATKFIEVRVTGAANKVDAHRVAMAIANSPLVKTAVAGEDANWGRVVMAVGKSGAQADRDLLTIRFGDMVLAEKGWRSPSYDEAKASAYMKRPELVIGVDLGLGRSAKTVWTCDLTHRYIDINADYRS